MPCTKTGCHIFIEPYQEYAYGDAYELEPVKDTLIWRALIEQNLIDQVHAIAYFRIVARSFTPINHMREIHFTVHNFDNWFDNGGSHPESHRGTSLLITSDYTKQTVRNPK